MNAQEARQNLEIIKNSIENTKDKRKDLYQFLLWIGMIFFVRLVVELAVFGLMNRSYYINNALSIISALSYIGVFIVCVRYYISISNSRNRYTNAYVKLSMFIFIFIPVVSVILRALSWALQFDADVMAKIFQKLDSIEGISNILLLLLCIILTGEILERKKFYAIATVIFTLYLVGYTLFGEERIHILHNQNIEVLLSGLIYSGFLAMGYFLLGILLKRNKGMKINGY